MYWFEAKEKEFSPVISTRVRFARNLEGHKFPRKMTPAEKKEVSDLVRGAFADEKTLYVDFGKAGPVEREAYVQTHLASRALADAGEGAGLLLSGDGSVAVMICEEDAVRLQAISKGEAIRETYEKALAWETKLEKAVPVAYDDACGYLTACPTNLGAAMRVSVMIHLPCLKATGRMNALMRSLSDAGYAVRGLFGEGSEESGAVYQISNQTSREAGPEEIVSAFENAVQRVILEEEKARDALLASRGEEVEDRIWRAWGTLTYARRLSFSEWIGLYSLIRLGLAAGRSPVKDPSDPDRALIEAMPAYLELQNAELADPALRDQARAERLRAVLGLK